MAFELITLPADLRGGVVTIKVPPGYKYVSYGASGEGAVILLQDHRCISHLAVQKIDLEVGPDFRPPLTPLQ